MISVERSFFDKFPQLESGHARKFSQPVVELLRKITCEERINFTLKALSPLTGFAFVERALERFQIRYQISPGDLENIPSDGRVVIVANHPLGAVDAMTLLHLVGSVRRDVRMLANDVLGQISALSALLLPINVFGGQGASAARLREAYRALEQEQALIVFPSGEVSRMRPQGVRDGQWSSGFVRMARFAQAPILPVHLTAHNSPAFYGMSMIAGPLSSLLLAREMFGATRKRPTVVVGELIPPRHFSADAVDHVAQAMRRHVYRIGKHRSGVFATIRAIAHPESPAAVRQDIRRAETVTTLADGKRVLLFDAQDECPLLREIGRLRELSFRRVGEGTGARRDLDPFDLHYRHLILWDDEALCVVGGYRLGEGARIFQSQGIEGFYSASLFNYSEQAKQFMIQGVELGRSFVQPAYWNSRSLDYLWQGMGAYLCQRQQLRYLFGPVSISAALPAEAREWIVQYYAHYFGDTESVAQSRSPFKSSEIIVKSAAQLWSAHDEKSALRLLKQRLDRMGCAIPTLYKHYVDICETDGVRFLAFGIDPHFGNCVDGLIRLDLSRMRANKRERYLRGSSPLRCELATIGGAA